MSAENGQPVTSAESIERLPSLAALQAAHKELLQAHRQEGDTLELLDRIERFIYQGQATGAVLDDEQERWTAQGVLDYWSATLFRADRRAPDATLVEFDPQLAPELPDELCPYVGLDPFREATEGKYFGRERLVSTLVEKLTDSRLLVVVGPSGSGKSSVVLAGLVPALKRGALPDSDSWRYMPSTVPGSNPLANLARLIQSVRREDEEDPVQLAQQQEKLLRENPRHLLDLVSAPDEAPVVGVVDQFEEAFTLCGDQQTRQAFIDSLTDLIQTPGARHTVIITMRSDFEPFVSRLPGFYPLFEQALVRVTPPSASELRDAIEKPAEKVGLKFEAGLVDQLLQDLLGEPAGLPLLQFTLLKLWENRSRNRITWEAYNRLGSGRVALARSADAFYDDLIPEEQVTAKRIFLRLVRPGEGLEFTSNRVRLRSLYQAGEARYRVDQVLEKLIGAHLLRVSEGDVAADTQVEVAHEALVRNWPRLVDWLEEERQNIRQRQGVSDAAERWIASGRDLGALYTTETLLLEALRVVQASGVALNDQEAEFLRASQELQDAVRKEKEGARQRELAFERQRADEQAASAKRLRRLAVVLVLVAFLALIASMAALGQRSSAMEAREIALAAAGAARAQRETAVVALLTVQMSSSADKTRVYDATEKQLAGIDLLRTAEAEKLVLYVANQTLEAQPATPAPSLTSVVATATWTPTITPIMAESITATRTAAGTQTATATLTATSPRTATASPTRSPGSSGFQSATATAAALATLQSEVYATQTAVVCDLPKVTEAASRYCNEMMEGWACYAGGSVTVEPPLARFNYPGDRAPLESLSSIETGPDGVLVIYTWVPDQPEPITLIFAGSSTVSAQSGAYVVSMSNGVIRCGEAPPGMVAYTKSGQPGQITVNGVPIKLQ